MTIQLDGVQDLPRLRGPRPAPSRRRPAPPPVAQPAEPRAPIDSELVARTARSLAIAALEVSCGLRRPATIARWVDPELFARLCRQAALRERLVGSGGPATRVLGAGVPRICRLSQTVAEAALVVATSRRHRALALRLELIADRWIATAFSGL
ncbi:Rv3235 family protein [Brevibacterium sp. 50QC2O2]|jgi:hypothetical protein|uniref:Rv3235 family protein n=1 Tax=Brevibacterium TaxID=1696 RepID=UPI00211BD767|nr:MULTISPECIES: Rv3235 family protein [unclassified Brevibacterium]MCQ9368494.1 Rv3235 family protein [Brevibacterium sp. 91QC2O2]MCQ9385926.1 Rv3235 family protein [Brevibacterium sp. 68QC2CO]MCQ9387408.1 Rv3235 family protein [Brevibacterium sp. 50QC2O2]